MTTQDEKAILTDTLARIRHAVKLRQAKKQRLEFLQDSINQQIGDELATSIRNVTKLLEYYK